MVQFKLFILNLFFLSFKDIYYEFWLLHQEVQIQGPSKHKELNELS